MKIDLFWIMTKLYQFDWFSGLWVVHILYCLTFHRYCDVITKPSSIRLVRSVVILRLLEVFFLQRVQRLDRSDRVMV